jgi:hypothetical protein
MKLAVFGLAALTAFPFAADAQGRAYGRPKQPREAVGTVSASGTSPSTASASGNSASTTIAPVRFPQFGSWLDDASTFAAGSGSSGFGFTYWRGEGATQIDAPIVNLAFGVTDRLQFGATVPFYRATYQDVAIHGLDDVYISGKFAAIDPAVNGHVGLAVGSILEVLSSASGSAQRVHWALPVSVEGRSGPVRVYGSAGYFSRGAVFAGGALEFTARTGTSVTAAVAQSHSTTATGSAIPGIAAQRVTDLTLSVAHPVTRSASVYVAGGRTLMDVSMGGAATSASGGMSFDFAPSACSP